MSRLQPKTPLILPIPRSTRPGRTKGHKKHLDQATLTSVKGVKSRGLGEKEKKHLAKAAYRGVQAAPQRLSDSACLVSSQGRERTDMCLLQCGRTLIVTPLVHQSQLLLTKRTASLTRKELRKNSCLETEQQQPCAQSSHMLMRS